MSACAAYGCKNRPHNKIPGITFHKFPKDISLRNEWLLALRRENFRPTKYSRLCSEHFSEDQIDRTSLACVRLRANAVPTIFKGYPKHLQKKLNQLSTENENMMGLKRKCTVEEDDEDYMSDERIDEPDETNTHSEAVEQINSSGTFLIDKNYTSETSNSTNKNGLSCHPNIMRIIPANTSQDVAVSTLFSNNNLDPDIIDALTASCQVDNPSTPDSSNSEALTESKLSNEIKLQRRIQQLEIMNLRYKKKIKILQQQNRRQKARIDTLQNRIKDLEANRTTDDDLSEDCISEDEIYEELLRHQMENNENSS
ncbi:THAP domain-containing protein 1-like [Argiope bruennichi]|uniref:THAP domain-containing protein 1-like n=1 Tax=Argiope bruennichi TaxID=94029 RepID=UPI0024954188|nr:THAP domain-containing protein 1-like [Argiope bruennichi]